MDHAKIHRPDRPRLPSRCTWSTDTSAGFVKLPSLSPVSTAVGKLDIGCHVGPGQHQYREVICEVCSSHYQTYQVFLCPPCSSLECGPSAQSPPPRLHQESRGVGYPTTPSSSSVSTSFQSDSDRRASHTSSISTQDLDSSEANDSPGVRNAKKREEANANHAMNEKRRRDSEKEKFETLQKMVEDIDGCLGLQNFRAKWWEKEANKYQQDAKRYKEERDKCQRKLVELQAQMQGHNLPTVGCSDGTDSDRVRAMQTDCKRRRTLQQIPKAPSGMHGLLEDTTDLDVKPSLKQRLEFRRVSYDRPQIPARQ